MQVALRRSAGAAPAALPRPALIAAVALSLVTGWVHLAYTESHFELWWGYGVFFLGVGLGQGLLGAALLRWPSARVALLGVVGNLLVVLTYVISRTDGVPFGPHADAAEKATTVDLLTTAGEIALVGLLLAMLGRTACRVAVNVILVLGVLLWVARLSGGLP